MVVRTDAASPPEAILLLFAIKNKSNPKTCSLHEHMHFAHRNKGCVVDPTPSPPTPLKLGQILRGVAEPIGEGVSVNIGVRNTRTVLWKHRHHRHTCNKPTTL